MHLYRTDDYDRAVALSREALTLYEQQGRADSSAAASTWSTIAVAREQQGHLEEAQEAIEHSIALGRRAWGPGHPALGRGYNALASIELSEGRWDEALRTLDQVLAMVVATTGDATDDGATVHENRGLALLKKGDLPAARAELERALAIWQAVGGDSPLTAIGLSNLGDLEREAGRPLVAMDDYRAAQVTLDRSKSPDPQTEGAILSSMGATQLDLKHFAEAERLLTEALALLAPFDPVDLAQTQFTMARTLDAVKKDRPRQMQLAQSALAAYEAGSGHSDDASDVRQWLLARQGEEPSAP